MIRSRAARLRVPVLALVLVALAGPAPAVAASNDPDGDGLPTAYETTKTRTSPLRADTDRDGIHDGREDLDGDRLTNGQERAVGTHPRRWDSDGDGRRDGSEDPDGDHLPHWFEFRAGTKPLRADSDRDGTRDGAEDADRDGLVNRQEHRRGTEPRRRDTDGDGWSDGAEVRRGTDPLDASSYPGSGHPPPVLAEAPTCPVFPASNVWNRRVDGLPLRADSATLVATIGTAARLHPDFGSYLGYGIPYNVVDAEQAAVRVSFDYDDESDDVPYPIPADPALEGGSDRHILVVDRHACQLYELFAARRADDGSWSAGSGATWDLRSNALRPAGWTSASRGSSATTRSPPVRSATRFASRPTRRAERTSTPPATSRRA